MVGGRTVFKLQMCIQYMEDLWEVSKTAWRRREYRQLKWNSSVGVSEMQPPKGEQNTYQGTLPGQCLKWGQWHTLSSRPQGVKTGAVETASNR